MAVTIGRVGTRPWVQEVAKTASYQVTAADNGTLFTTTGATGAVTFTLPTLANGAATCYWFLNAVGQNMIIAAPSGKLIVLNNSAATNANYNTANQLIGAMCMVYMNDAGTFYVHQGTGTHTVVPN